MISLGKIGIGQLIENQPARAAGAAQAIDPTPLRALASAPGRATPRGAARAPHSLPLAVRPSALFKAKGDRA